MLRMKQKNKKIMEMFGKMVEEAIKNPESAPDKLVVISLSEEEKNRVLTPEKLRLIRIIKSGNPKNVKALAKLANRRVDAVSRDLKVLSFYGFLELLQVGKQKMPKIKKDVLMIPLTG
jgi:predicted transcriptional regulator